MCLNGESTSSRFLPESVGIVIVKILAEEQTFEVEDATWSKNGKSIMMYRALRDLGMEAKLYIVTKVYIKICINRDNS
jgi:hypothetical protein